MARLRVSFHISVPGDVWHSEHMEFGHLIFLFRSPFRPSFVFTEKAEPFSDLSPATVNFCFARNSPCAASAGSGREPGGCVLADLNQASLGREGLETRHPPPVAHKHQSLAATPRLVAARGRGGRVETNKIKRETPFLHLGMACSSSSSAPSLLDGIQFTSWKLAGLRQARMGKRFLLLHENGGRRRTLRLWQGKGDGAFPAWLQLLKDSVREVRLTTEAVRYSLFRNGHGSGDRAPTPLSYNRDSGSILKISRLFFPSVGQIG
eukprot:g34718.t1